MFASKLTSKPPYFGMKPSSSFLLACSGFTVISATMCGSALWGDNFIVGLSMMFLAAVLALGAFHTEQKEEFVDEPEEGSPRQFWIFLAVVILFHILFAIFLTHKFPGNNIDCFTFQRDASKSLINGVDPFGTTQTDIYGLAGNSGFYGPGMVVNGRVQVGFQYPPLTLLWVIPGYLLGDVRYSYVVAVILSAVILFAIHPAAKGFYLAAFLLLSPMTFYVENRCWTEPLVLVALSATLYAAVKKRWWLPIALGLFLATKQYNFLALPFIGFLVRPFGWRSYLKLVVWSLAVAAITVVPFAFWNAHALWHDTVLFHLAQPFRTDSLSFAVPFPFMLKVGPLLVLAFAVWSLRVGVRSVAMFAAGYGLCLLLFVVTSKQAFCNYYFLIGQTLLLAAAAMPQLASKRHVQVESVLI